MEMTVHIPDVWALSKTQLFAAPNIFRFSFYLVFHLFHPHWLNPDCLRRSCKEDRACRLASSSFTACTGSCVLTYPTAGHHGQRTHILSLILIMCPFLSSSFSRFWLQVHVGPSSLLPPAHHTQHSSASTKVYAHSPANITERSRRRATAQVLGWETGII